MTSTTMPAVHRADAWLGLTVFGLVLFGVVMVYSASIILAHTQYGDDHIFVRKQIVSAVIGFIGLLVMTNIDYHFWRRWAGWMLVGTLLLLVSVFFFSAGEINGAHRWINLAGQQFQPSELAKLTFIIYVSAWLTERQKEIGDIKRTFLPYVAVLGVVSLLMLKEPDFGTLMIILVPAIAIYYIAGMTWKQVALGLIVLVLGLSLVLTTPYRRQRLMTFLNQSSSSSSQSTTGSTADDAASYHVNNIAIAVGSGGAWGLGFGQSKQKRRFLPEPHTDSIFAVITEELGSVRATLLIVAFCFLIYRGFLVAVKAPDLFGRLIAVGIIAWIGFQTFINLGSMLSLVPLVGVPLPFISYGGTSLIITLSAVGLLLNISRQGVAPISISNKEPGRKKVTHERR